MIFGREPAAILNAASAVVALLVGFNAFGLTEDVGQAAIALASALTTAWLAFRVRPLAPTLLTGVITSGVAALAAVNLVHITQRQTGLIVAAAEILLTAIIVRPQSTPLADPRPPEYSV
jgi:hypothetical protein